MPRSLDAIARAYAGGSVDFAVGSFDADTFRVLPHDGDPRPALVQEIDQLLGLGFRPEQIGVITLVGQGASQLFGSERLGSHRVVNADHEDAPSSIVVETFLRFQGLDRAVLLLCEGHLDAANYRYEERMHMALTRATTAVVLVADGGLWARDDVLTGLRDHGKLDAALA
jgi:hypothetical protein